MHKLDSLLQTKMTRKQFLQTSGTGLLGVFGLSAILRILDYSGSSADGKADNGYGSGNYGGVDHSHLHNLFGKQ